MQVNLCVGYCYLHIYCWAVVCVDPNLFANPLYHSLHEGKLPKWSNCSAGLIGKLIAGLGQCLPLLQVPTLSCSKELGVWSQQKHSLHSRGASCSLHTSAATGEKSVKISWHSPLGEYDIYCVPYLLLERLAVGPVDLEGKSSLALKECARFSCSRLQLFPEFV